MIGELQQIEVFSWAFWLLLAMTAFVGVALLLLASNGMVALLAWIDDRDRRRATQDAATFDEPTREQVEERTDDNWRLFGDGEAYFAAADFEAQVLRDIPSLPSSGDRTDA